MPTYDYRCTDCGAEYDLQLKIDERDAPLSIPCPNCDKAGTIERFLLTPPGFGDPMRLGRIRTPDSFKDVLRNIKKKHIHSTINTQ